MSTPETAETAEKKVQLQALVRAAVLAARNQGETWGSRGGSSYYSTAEDVGEADAAVLSAVAQVIRAIEAL